ncbi:MAG: FMN-binding protein [Hydrogenobacter sp.]
MCRWCLFMSMIFCFICFATDGTARDFKTPEQALKDAFPGAKIEVKNLILSKDQLEKIERLSGMKLGTRLISWYIAKKGNNVIGYAYIDSHTVRTHPEVVLYTITPDGKIDLIEVLSFNEPLEYMPDENWLRLFRGKELTPESLRLRKDIPNMTGATLTSRAITDNTRKVLAMWKVIFGGER